MFLFAGTLLLQLSTLAFHSRGAAGDVDLTFDPGSGVNGAVQAIVVQPDGKVIIGGNFTTVKGLLRHGLARLNADGSGDSTFNPGGSYGIVASSLALQPDGKVLVGHYYGIARLNSDGSLDAGFNATTTTIREEDGEVFPAPVNAIAVQPDGKVLVGGDFTVVNGTNRMRMARLNANGSLDTSFEPDTALHQNVASVVLQPDGKVIIGGDFSTTNGIGIARLNSNGNLDNGFNPGIEAYGVRSVALQPDGKVIIGGIFAFTHGTNVNYGIARLNANGSLDSSFNSGSGAYGVSAVALQSDGKVLLSGAFTNVNGTSRGGMARLHTSGSVDASFTPDANDAVHSLATRSDGKVMIGGRFNTVSGVASRKVARLNHDGTLDSSFDPGSGGDHYSVIRSVVTASDGQVLVGGNFATVKGLDRNRIARLHTDASGDSSFNPGTGADNEVLAVLAQPDGKVLIGGHFTTVNGVSRFNVARLNGNGTLDTGFVPPIGANEYGSAYTSMALQPDGRIILGGFYSELFPGGDSEYVQTRFQYLRLNANGSVDSSFAAGTGGEGSYILSVALQADGKVLFGGYIDPFSNPGPGLIRRNSNGSADASFNPGLAASTYVGSIAVQPDGKILVGGNVFSFLNSGVIRLNSTGAVDGSFASAAVGANSTVYSIALQPDGKLLVGGDFTAINDTSRNSIARFNANGTIDLGFNPGTGADGRVRSIALQPDGNVLIAGDFTSVNGVVRPLVARLYGESSAPSLTITRSGSFMTISWPVTTRNFQLQESANLALPNVWLPVAQPTMTNGTQISVSVSGSAGPKFFRLQWQ